MSALPLNTREIDVLEHPGLFMVPLAPLRATASAAKRHEPPATRPGRLRVAPTNRHKRGHHRYCSGCAQETEHAASAANGLGTTRSIRWPTTGPVIGTTFCLNCGQWRAANPQPRPPTWSSWPRSRITTPSLAIPADSTDSADNRVSQSSAENVGMPSRREPQRPRPGGARLRRARAVAARQLH